MHEEKNNLPSLRSLPDSAIHLLCTADSEILSDSEILNSFSALSRPQPTSKRRGAIPKMNRMVVVLLSNIIITYTHSLQTATQNV